MNRYNSLNTIIRARHWRDPHGELVHAQKIEAIWPWIKGAILLALFMLSAGVVMAVFAAVWGLVA